MARNIAVAGKGGTGKTTFAALLIRYLLEKGKKSILAVDADPNANLNEALGIPVSNFVADILEEAKDSKGVPPGMTKDMFIEYKLAQALVETERLDLLVMGRPQGPGCYCYPNDILRKHLETLSRNYQYVVIDSEAGLEHISRRIIQGVEFLFVLSDATIRGIRSAGRVRQLVEELQLPIPHMLLVVTRVQGSLNGLVPEIERTGLPLAGTISFDPLVVEYDALGRPLFDLPSSSLAVRETQRILEGLAL
ncbi:CO dehydrogenase maturation factor [Thermanaeromonas toyohensis ToBE]|uniref:CO dehydrogenase maturation factor n=1 Tax=Thermanaeromonas toyohensis ToBE TaxID=698762 RepID=A0A1W1VXI2_9FIRM|nr:AAA family ATPase [Thermanaeromonas toyohensis]SMB98092.1 CO dehydrogenase maturation factor [Thermanaeromonas toyohensis ToBE]